MKPNLADVLAAMRPGRVVRLSLTPEQRRTLADRDARLALNVVSHLLGARAASVAGTPPDRFPLTEPMFQAVARKLGTRVGIKRSRAIIRRLVAAGVLENAGSYRQRYRNQGGSVGFRVALYRLGALLAPLRRKRAVGRGRAVKRRIARRWWQHPLFGDHSGLPPPEITRARAARMRSVDEREAGRGPSLVERLR